MNYPLLISILGLLVISSSFAQWEPKDYELGKSFISGITDPFSISAKMICEKKVPYYTSISKNSKTLFYRSSKLSRSALRLKLLKQNNPSSLMVVVPGSFNNLNSKMPRSLAKIFFDLGYHVLVLPNPLGTDFIKNKAQFPPGSMFEEAILFLKAIQYGLTKIDSKQLKDIHIMGVSYGGHLATMISGLDTISDKPINFKTTIAYAPPFDIKKSFDLLDSYISEVGPKVSLLSKHPSIFRLCKAQNDHDLKLKDFSELKKIVIHYGFKMELISSVSKYDSINHLDKCPPKPYGEEYYDMLKPWKKWTQTLDYENYFLTYAPLQYQELSQDYGKIFYWMNLLTKKNKDVRVLTTNDDFINEKNIWPTDDNRVLILNGGGHYGFRDSSWFKIFLKSVYTSH